jgi:hypothetical protein
MDHGIIISRLDWQQEKIMALIVLDETCVCHLWIFGSGDNNELWPLYWNTNKSVAFILQGKCLKCWSSLAMPVHIPVHKSVRPLKNLDGQCYCIRLYSWSHTIRFLTVWPFGRQPVRTRCRRMLCADDFRGRRVTFTGQECVLLFRGGRRLKMGTILKNNCAFSNVILNSIKFLCV